MTMRMKMGILKISFAENAENDAVSSVRAKFSLFGFLYYVRIVFK